MDRIDIYLPVIIILLVMILWALTVLIGETRLNWQKLNAIESHQLNPRTRISQARMDNTPDDEIKQGRRAGQVSRGKRIVVGGDPDSELHRSLTRGVEAEDDDNPLADGRGM